MRELAVGLKNTNFWKILNQDHRVLLMKRRIIQTESECTELLINERSINWNRFEITRITITERILNSRVSKYHRNVYLIWKLNVRIDDDRYKLRVKRAASSHPEVPINFHYRSDDRNPNWWFWRIRIVDKRLILSLRWERSDMNCFTTGWIVWWRIIKNYTCDCVYGVLLSMYY